MEIAGVEQLDNGRVGGPFSHVIRTASHSCDGRALGIENCDEDSIRRQN